jgi:hypothetical protein
MTLHTAPLAKNFLFGGFQSRERMFLGMAPDRQWMTFTRALSQGSLARSATAEEQASHANVFDWPQFIYRYEQRRIEVEKEKAPSAAGVSATPGK